MKVAALVSITTAVAAASGIRMPLTNSKRDDFIDNDCQRKATLTKEKILAHFSHFSDAEVDALIKRSESESDDESMLDSWVCGADTDDEELKPSGLKPVSLAQTSESSSIYAADTLKMAHRGHYTSATIYFGEHR